ncbi:MAG: S8 family peptidase [Clostridiaceae bacterium]
MIFQEESWIRSNVYKFCPSLKKQALDWYKPFRFVPHFLQRYFKRIRQHFRKVPVIVQMHPSREISFTINSLSKSSGCKIHRELHSINAFSTKVNAKKLEKLITDNMVKMVWYDGTVKTVLDVAAPAVKAPGAWNTNKTTGKGIGIAVIDTGVYPHPDLSGRIIAFKDFVGKKTAPYDDNGHGTHVAGDMASDGALYKGTAPGADIIGVKVLNKSGSGYLSTVIAGIQWCINNKDLYGIKVISISLGSTAVQSYKDDPVCEVVGLAWTSGITVCAAAGNEGPESGTISSPGINPRIITVGAIDDKNSLNFNDYEIAGFSSRGPTIDNLPKPDIVCPGTNIISLRSPYSTIDKQNKSARVGKRYISLSGTSMATPICAGMAALILETDSTLTPDAVKDILKNTARPLNNLNAPNIQGNGLADAEEATKHGQVYNKT